MNSVDSPLPAGPAGDLTPTDGFSIGVPPAADLVQQFRRALQAEWGDESSAPGAMPMDAPPFGGITWPAPGPLTPTSKPEFAPAFAGPTSVTEESSGAPEKADVLPSGSLPPGAQQSRTESEHPLPTDRSSSAAIAGRVDEPARSGPPAPLRVESVAANSPALPVHDSVPSPPPPMEGDADTLGMAVLQSFTQQAAAPAPTRAATSPQQALPPALALVAETVCQVLVSDPLRGGRQEVRLELAPDLLPQTSIRLWRDEGRLHVEFIAPSAVAERGLKEALPRLGELILHRQLESELPQVTLRLRESTFDAHAGDGRSRQRYVPLPDEQQEA